MPRIWSLILIAVLAAASGCGQQARQDQAYRDALKSFDKELRAYASAKTMFEGTLADLEKANQSVANITGPAFGSR